MKKILSKPESPSIAGDEFEIIVDAELKAHLENLASLGLYGSTPSEVARRLIEEGIERRFSK